MIDSFIWRNSAFGWESLKAGINVNKLCGGARTVQIGLAKRQVPDCVAPEAENNM